MSTVARRRRRAWAIVTSACALILLHEICLRVMAEAGVVDRLLSAGGAESLVAVAAALAFVALRLFVVFVVPALLLVAVLTLVWPASKRDDGRGSARRVNEPSSAG